MKASWRQRAACRGVDPDVFYPVSDDDAEEAKMVCTACTVRQACLEYSLAAREREGVWGGLTERSVAASSATTVSPPDSPPFSIRLHDREARRSR